MGIPVLVAFILILTLALPAWAAAGLTLQPSTGEPGDVFVVTGQGFDPGEPVKLTWDGASLGGPIKADDTGGFTATVTVPSDAASGGHQVVASDRPPDQRTATATYVVGAPTTTVTTAPTTTTTTAAGSPTTAPSDTGGGASGGGGTSGTSGTSGGSGSSTGLGDPGETTQDAPGEDGPPGVEATTLQAVPGESAPGEAVVIEAVLSGEIEAVIFSLGGEALGASQPVAEDGSVRARRVVPALETGTHWLQVETVEGAVLGRVEFEVIEPQMALSPAAIRRTLTAGPLGWLFVFLALALGGLCARYMWSKPKKDDKHQPAPQFR